MKIKSVSLVCLFLLTIMVFTACGSAQKDFSPDLDALYEKLLSDTDTDGMTVLSDRKIENYMGIAAQDYAKAIIAICGDSVSADEIWLVEAVDDAAAGRIKALAEERLEYQAEAMKNYLPDQYEILKQGKVLVKGRYVALFVSPEVEKMQALFESA